ncbi:MAG: putative bifunctional diguanylate cyclase/phosphodiesterase, partial [Gammaproteobacteria bacterium]
MQMPPEERLQAILATIDNVVWSISADHYQTLYLNPAAERVYGRPVKAFYDDAGLFFNIVDPQDRGQLIGMLSQLVEKGSMAIEYRIVRPDGEIRWLEDRVVVASGPEGRPVRFDGVASDITERKRHEAQLSYLATHDALTQLPNRNLLNDRITQAVAHAQRGGHTFGVLMLDLDRFKRINDSYGHLFGDSLLQALASQLRSAVRQGDTVARLGGDEFVVLLGPVGSPEDIIPAVRRLLDLFSHPFTVQGTELHATASIGVAVFPGDGTEPETLLKNADTAMYRAKEQGRNGFQFFAPEMSVHACERLELENALRRALEREELELHFQPQVDVKTGALVAVEALLRWRHPTLGLVPPDKFIDIAEESGLIVPIGTWVLQTACAQNKAWQDAGLPRLRVAVNVSAKQFWQGQLLQTVKRVLTETHLAPGDVELEITETVFLRDIDETVRTILELRTLGVVVSMDDFGTGYSSLNYLRRLPIEKLKIDRSF